VTLGFHVAGMTSYMFNPHSALFLRGLSLFHGWLPFLLCYLVFRLGYDRRISCLPGSPQPAPRGKIVRQLCYLVARVGTFKNRTA
jgi:hypothetical protein